MADKPRRCRSGFSPTPLEEQLARRVVSCAAVFMRLGGGDPGKALILAAREIVRLRSVARASAREEDPRP